MFNLTVSSFFFSLFSFCSVCNVVIYLSICAHRRSLPVLLSSLPSAANPTTTNLTVLLPLVSFFLVLVSQKCFGVLCVRLTM
ncbi:GPI-anchored surface protein, putative [Bodo saltans]|uniref:GPI-anchored surface protein, putative n=1 Tax=Bodo saltans TaxID=75058 RepID=A0A0S4KLC4_BODSA|nr:GPI-anchored surface protein, putative [Bodo saltans]|eukprot:CUI15203.1 GPI-anchored surface protein, putative [Bodo saltans]